MTITIDATEGGEDSNSYVTLVEASAYFEAKPAFSTLWLALAEAAQNAWLVESTRCLDRFEYIASRYNGSDQALCFPRTVQDATVAELLYLEGEDLGTVPTKVKNAQCELIMALYDEGLTAGGEADRGVSEVDIAGAVKVKFDDIAAVSTRNDLLLTGTYAAVRALLSPWLSGSENTIPFEK